MSCVLHPNYDHLDGPPRGNKVKDFSSPSFVKAGMYTLAPCGHCWTLYAERVEIVSSSIRIKWEDQVVRIKALEKDVKDHQYAGGKLADALSNRRKVIAELEQRVLDEQSAFDKLEELYLQERESFRVLTKQLGEEVAQSLHHYNRAEALEKSMEITQESIERNSVNFNLAMDEMEEIEGTLHKMLKEVVYQLEGLLQYISEEEELDDDVTALYDELLKDAWKVLGENHTV